MSDTLTTTSSAATAGNTAALTVTTPTLPVNVTPDGDGAVGEWQRALQKEHDAAGKEWMALERRYNLRLLGENAATRAKTVALFLCLSDPDLPQQFRGGEVQLQLELPEKYPDESPVVDFAQWSSRLTAPQVSALNAAFRTQATSLRGSLALRKLLTWIDNNLVQFVGEDDDTPRPPSPSADNDTTTDDTGASAPSPATGELSEQAKSKRKSRRRPCHFFARGKCTNGDQCQYSHDPRKPKSAPTTGTEAQETESKGPSASKGEDQASKASKSKGKTPDTKAERTDKATRFCKFFARNSCKEGDKCKYLHERKPSMRKLQPTKQAAGAPEVATDEVIDLEQASSKREAKVSEAMTATSPASNSDEWTEAQQHALDLALKAFPTTMDKKERWTSIANAVDGRTLNECIDRFKYLSQLIRQQQQQQQIVNKTDNTRKRSQSPRKEPAPALTDEDVVDDDATAEVADGSVVDSRLIPQDARVAIETEPAVRGAQIRLEDLFLYEIGTVIPHRLTCQVACANCPLHFDAVLSLDNAEIHKWCPRCSALHDVALRPVFAHTQSNVLAYIDTSNCAVVDVLPSEVVATCLGCGSEALMDKLTPGRRSEMTCFACHVKLVMQMKRYVVGNVTSGAAAVQPGSTTADKKKKTEKRIIETFEVGKPLPDNGVCEHYKHSYRWFRFQCCGKAFPCDVCHDASDCAEANMGKIASRMICGMCSREQSSQVKLCSCGNKVGRKSLASAHWEGGKGCRNQALMASTDKQKFRGRNKTESKKFKRVGAEAKARRTSSRGPDSS